MAALEHPAPAANRCALGCCGADVADCAVRAAQAAPAMNLQPRGIQPYGHIPCSTDVIAVGHLMLCLRAQHVLSECAMPGYTPTQQPGGRQHCGNHARVSATALGLHLDAVLDVVGELLASSSLHATLRQRRRHLQNI